VDARTHGVTTDRAQSISNPPPTFRDGTVMMAIFPLSLCSIARPHSSSSVAVRLMIRSSIQLSRYHVLGAKGAPLVAVLPVRASSGALQQGRAGLA